MGKAKPIFLKGETSLAFKLPTSFYKQGFDSFGIRKDLLTIKRNLVCARVMSSCILCDTQDASSVLNVVSLECKSSRFQFHFGHSLKKYSTRAPVYSNRNNKKNSR